MTRQSDREGAAALLVSLNSYAAVYDAPRRAFDGLSPVASVVSQGMQAQGKTRGGPALTNVLAVSLYVRADSGSEAAAEDQLDSLTRAAVLAFVEARWDIGSVDALPDGAPLRNIDGALYRVERIIISREEYT